MSIIEYAKRELSRVGLYPSDDEIQNHINDNILELLEVFSKQGHSGSSGNYCLNVFNKLVRQEPLGPLLGTEDEWNEVGEDKLQNKFCSTVFKEKSTNKAYWIEGRIFKDKDGCHFTNGDSHIEITFPWTKPESEIICL